MSFIEREYDFLPVKDRVVIDIGSNIGDSSIYFALKGAKRVIGIEHDPQVNDFANKHIELNGFSDRIELIRGAISNTDGNTKSLKSVFDYAKWYYRKVHDETQHSEDLL
jgi:FkbM family methyltransferase